MQSTDLSAIKLDPGFRGRRITADYVADGLREAIQSGQLADGAVLNQAAIAAHFGVSRVPVREAMRQLLAEGLIESQAHHLAVVRGLPIERLAEIYDNRALLEAYLVERATPQVTTEVIQRLREIELGMRDVVDHSRWLEQNAEFHDLINRAARDVTGTELVGQLRLRAQRYVRMWSGGAGVHRPEEAGKEHAEILDRIEAGDAAGARAAVEHHIRHTGELLVAYGRSIEGSQSEDGGESRFAGRRR
jgi:DNA-binding GntR family transcriptional regulator